jgi:hypothetical protein
MYCARGPLIAVSLLIVLALRQMQDGRAITD